MKKNTSERLKEIMRLQGIRQVDIINMCKNNPYGLKLNKSDLSQYVSGKFLPKQDKLTLLSYALNVSEAWLMGYDVPMKKQAIEKSNTDIEDDNKNCTINQIQEKLKSLNINELAVISEIVSLINGVDEKTLEQITSYINFLKSQGGK